MSIRKLKSTVRAHTVEIARQKINLSVGTMRSITTNGTIIRPSVNETNVSNSSSTSTVPRWV